MVAIGLCACGSASRTPQVASLVTSTNTRTSSSSGSTGARTTTRSGSTTVRGKRDPTRLVNEWATCMHSHGDPNQADPTIDAYGVINVNIPGIGQLSNELSNEVHAGTDPCNQYIAAAQAALRAANPVAPPPDQAELIRYTDCMRANGVPDYPYPSAHMTFQGTGVDPYSPSVIRVNNLCGRKLSLPAWWVSGNGEPGEVSVSNGPPLPNGGQPPPCFYAKTGCPKGSGNGPRPASGGATPVQPGG